MKKYISLILIFVFIFSISLSTKANQNNLDIQNSNAQALLKLDILRGYEDGSLRLENNIRRSEFITLVVRLMGYHNDDDIDNVNITFKDIEKNHWAYNNIRLAVKYDLVAGYPDNTIAPNNNVTFAEALAVVIRALGYENTLEGTWPDNVINKATELNLDKNLSLKANQQITRGEMSVIVYNALTVKLNTD
ncbi:UNVERIFIED_CONTAM: S-layer family protein [Acetivibrio alkalicellulosi]